MREVDILRKVQHKNIVALHEVYEEEKYLYLLLDLVKGGELYDLIVEKSK
jgi:serine/threonine protein kinase